MMDGHHAKIKLSGKYDGYVILDDKKLKYVTGVAINYEVGSHPSVTITICPAEIDVIMDDAEVELKEEI